MVNRIVLGQRSAGELGLYISWPGYDVLTCSSAEMSFYMGSSMCRILAQGLIIYDYEEIGTKTVPILNTGTVPMAQCRVLRYNGSGLSALDPLSDGTTLAVTASSLSVTRVEAMRTVIKVTYTVFVEASA